MMQIIKNELDPNDYDIVLSESLCDENGDYYDLTFKQALDEQCSGKPLIWCKYVLNVDGPGKVLKEFLGYTDTRVIFHLHGIGVVDLLLDSIPRNPPNIERFTI